MSQILQRTNYILFCNETELKSLLYLLQMIVSERSTSICRSHTDRFHVNPISFFNTLNSPILITKLTAFILNIAEKTNKQCLRFRFIQEISWNQVLIILIQTFSLSVSLFFFFPSCWTRIINASIAPVFDSCQFSLFASVLMWVRLANMNVTLI